LEVSGVDLPQFLTRKTEEFVSNLDIGLDAEELEAEEKTLLLVVEAPTGLSAGALQRIFE
jgi:hypothetical protein